MRKPLKAFLIAVAVLFFTPLFYHLPQAVLAAVIKDPWNFDPAVEGGRARHRCDAVRLSSVARRECAPSSQRLA